MTRIRIPRLLVATLFASFAAQALALEKPESMPLRVDHPETQVIEMEVLREQMAEYTILDVRSPYEYNVLHIRDAVNLSVADMRYRDRLKELYAAKRKPIVTYCNGESCPLSFLAAEVARSEQIPVFVYDAGIWYWARNYPEATVLMPGAKRLIPPEEFKAHLLKANEFEAGASKDEALLIDVRTLMQAGRGVRLWPAKQHNVPLDTDDLTPYFAQAMRERRPLYLYDDNGHQVRWVQYAIERAGVKQYFFLEGGASGYEHASMGAGWKPLGELFSQARPARGK